MTTTAVFAEIIVVGLEAEAWLALLVLAIFGDDWVDVGAVNEWTALLTILVLAAAYVLGIIVDRLADTTVSFAARKLEPRWRRIAAWFTKRFGDHKKKHGPSHQDKRLLVLYKSGGDGMAKFLDYQRSRMRVARGTALNTMFAIPAVVAFLWAETDAAPAWIIGAAVAGVLALALAFYTNERIHCAYEKNLDAAYGIVRRG